MSSEVYFSPDFGVSWLKKQVDMKKILVIRPGAGTQMNSRMYNEITQHGYSIEYLGVQNIDDGYPLHWSDNKNLVLQQPFKKVREKANLLELAGKFPTVKDMPALIICGSRGCQVTIGIIWRHFWRGPSIIINAGCIMQKAHIPKGVFPVVLPCGKDTTFHHHDPRNIAQLFQLFQENSEVDGILLFMKSQGHMPVDMHQIIIPLIKLTLHKELDLNKWNMFPTWCEVKLLRHKIRFTTQNINPQNTYTLLRQTPTKHSQWGSKVKNGEEIELLQTLQSDDGFLMYKIKTQSKEEGYIYARNVKS